MSKKKVVNIDDIISEALVGRSVTEGSISGIITSASICGSEFGTAFEITVDNITKIHIESDDPITISRSIKKTGVIAGVCVDRSVEVEPDHVIECWVRKFKCVDCGYNIEINVSLISKWDLDICPQCNIKRQ